MPPHNTAAMPLRQALTRSVAEEIGAARAVPFDPNAHSFEAFSCGMDKWSTRLLEPLKAATLKDALAETTSRWSWHRGSRLAVREIGDKIDLLHVYACRQKASARQRFGEYRDHSFPDHWLDHICTINLNVIAGLPIGLVGCERDIHARRQAQRPEGAVK